MKLLSGFGLIITVANGILWLLNRFTEKFSKKEVQILVIIQIIIPGILAGYAIYSIISSLPPTAPATGFSYWIDLLLFLYGILSLIISPSFNVIILSAVSAILLLCVTIRID